jgi:hypothetical protein
MKRLVLLITLALSILGAPLAAHGQPAPKVYRIGYIVGTGGWDATAEALKERLRELGYRLPRRIGEIMQSFA